MRIVFRCCIAAVATLLLAVPLTPAHAQKPKSKLAEPQKNRPYVLGTKQLPGEFGKFGTTYTVGSREPLNITLLRAEYTTARLVHDSVYDGAGLRGMIPPKDKKWLVLHLTVQNPLPQDQRLSSHDFAITAVDGGDLNYKVESAFVRDSAPGAAYPTGTHVDMPLKPAQKIAVMCALLVPASGEIPKLIIGRGQDEAAGVVRYDLRGNVGKLPADIAGADPVTPKEAYPATVGTFYPFRMFDFALDGAAFSDAPYFGKPAKDGRFFVVRLKVRAVGKGSQLNSGTFKARLKTEDGETLEPQSQGFGSLYFASRDEAYNNKLDLGDELSLRMVFLVPGTAAVATLSIADGSPDKVFRPYVFDVQERKKD